MKTFILLCIALFVTLIKSEQKQPTQSINVKIYDQFPEYNKNFEPDNGELTQGIVKKNLINVPELLFLTNNTAINRNGRILSPENFKFFFQPNQTAPKEYDSGLNYPLARTLTLNLDVNTNNYVYDNQNFFPIDNDGFDLDSKYRKYQDAFTGQYHNYHFCMSFSNKFTYKGYEIFNFVGDDDVWVYIDNKLVVDLGGLHIAQSASVDVTSLGLAKGGKYQFDFFYCERHTSKSTIKIETSIDFFCPIYDYCGVCKGDGSTCCNAATGFCDDNDLCTTDYCPEVGTPMTDGIPLKEYCIHIDKPNKWAGNKCERGKCNPKTGLFVQNSTVCPDKANECLISNSCDPDVGCIYKSTCTDICSTNKCVGGKCETKTSDMCATQFGDSPPDECSIYSCEPGTGCTKKPKCPASSNPCEVVSCNKGQCQTTAIPVEKCNCTCPGLTKCQMRTCNADGSCTPKPLPEINDQNECTIDSCDDSTGTITHAPSNKCSGCNQCNPKSGTCDPINTLCDDGNQCSTDICVANGDVGNCTKKSSTHCVGADKCRVYTCDAETGCNSTALVCPDQGRCSIGFCNPDKGVCEFKPRVCHSDWFCLDTECDEQFGCITYEKRCAPDNGRCQTGICQNNTAIGKEDGKCISEDYDPKPFICKTAAVVSTAVVAGVVVAGAVALAAAIYGGKRGFDYWKQSQNNTMATSSANPLYEANPSGGENPLYNNAT